VQDLNAACRKELGKAAFALPSVPSPVLRASLARNGFDHSDLIFAILRSQVPAHASDSLIRHKFRDAIAAKKLDSSVCPDRLAIKLVKEHLDKCA